MTSNAELSEIKQLLYSLASDLQDVKSDLAELKKTQPKSSKATSTCLNSATGGSKPSSIEKAVTNAETKLAAKVRSTQSAVSQLIEEEKTLILAEVVQLSRAVGDALESAKGKMMEKVAGVTDGIENDRKRSWSKADMDVDDDLAGEKRIRHGYESDTDEDQSDYEDSEADDTDEDSTEDDASGDEELITPRRLYATALDDAVLDIMGRASMALDCDRVGREWVLMALYRFHSSAADETLKLWQAFQKHGKVDFEYCLYGLFYHGHEHEGVASGACSCRERHPPGLRQRATRCIRVKRKEDDFGSLRFSWGADIGPAPVLGKYE